MPALPSLPWLASLTSLKLCFKALLELDQPRSVKKKEEVLALCGATSPTPWFRVRGGGFGRGPSCHR